MESDDRIERVDARGMATIGSYSSRSAAELDCERLLNAGIDAGVIDVRELRAEPGQEPPEPFILFVRPQAADDAQQLLSAIASDLPLDSGIPLPPPSGLIS